MKKRLIMSCKHTQIFCVCVCVCTASKASYKMLFCGLQNRLASRIDSMYWQYNRNRRDTREREKIYEAIFGSLAIGEGAQQGLGDGQLKERERQCKTISSTNTVTDGCRRAAPHSAIVFISQQLTANTADSKCYGPPDFKKQN